jgi:hypothetical protein
VLYCSNLFVHYRAAAYIDGVNPILLRVLASTFCLLPTYPRVPALRSGVTPTRDLS